MLTITLKPDMTAQVNQLASETQSDAATVVDKALRNYLTEFRHKKIRAEHAEFDRQRPELLNRYRGEYVAIHQGQVIDHDRSLWALHSRVLKQLGDMPVLLKRVTDKPERELVFRSPRFERPRP